MQSNNSKKLSISVTDFVQNDSLQGQRIAVEHEDFGVLFACVLRAVGTIVEPLTDNITVEFTPDQIIQELAKYGFLVSYIPTTVLSPTMIEYLMNIRKFRFEKLRILNVWELDRTNTKVWKWYVVAFNSVPNGQWLNSWYSPSKREFLTAIQNGSCINISAIGRTRGMDFSWLAGWVANIDDILNDNMGTDDE